MARLKSAIKQLDGIGLSMFTDDQLEVVHCATLEILDNHGIKVPMQDARDIFDGGGCIVDNKTNMVKIPPHIVEDSIRSAPWQFLAAGRTPKDDFIWGGKNIGFTNFGQAVTVVDPVTREGQKSTKEHVKNAARMIDAMDELDICERPCGSDDYPEQVETIHNAEAIFSNTSKFTMLGSHCAYNVRKIIELAATCVGGMDKFRERPIYGGVCCPTSPLMLDRVPTDTIIECARGGAPVLCITLPMAGGTSPVTFAGTLVVLNAEVLAGLVLSELTCKGSKFVYGSTATIMDLRDSTAPVGCPELGMFGAAAAKLAQYYQLPSIAAGG